MTDDEYTIESGHLDVGEGHKIYFQRWGNPKSKPIFFLHGGPGSGCKDKHKVNFDPKRQQLIYHDQRGAGLSIPFAETKHNSTDRLVEDIEKLRKKFGFNRIQLTGGSWGSFLSLAYAVTYPVNVEKILVCGIFTGTKREVDYIQQGGLKTHYPEAWEQYIEIVPDKFKQDTAKYYLDKMLRGSIAEREEHTRRWNLLESSAMSIDSDYSSNKLSSIEFKETDRALAILEAYYFVNNCFVDDNFLYKNVVKLKNIPVVMVHGRFDHVCPPESAHKLSKLIGDQCHLQIVPASHGNEASLREAMRAYNWSFLS